MKEITLTDGILSSIPKYADSLIAVNIKQHKIYTLKVQINGLDDPITYHWVTLGVSIGNDICGVRSEEESVKIALSDEDWRVYELEVKDIDDIIINTLKIPKVFKLPSLLHQVAVNNDVLPSYRIMKVPHGYLYNFFNCKTKEYNDAWTFVKE